jgi:protein tyrosine phosphatase
MAEQVVQMTAHCPKNIVQFKRTIYVLMMHQVDLFPITMLFCHINSKSNKMNCEKVERTVHHFHLTQWPDHGVPDKIKLVSFYRKVKRTKTTLNGPLTVHCR